MSFALFLKSLGKAERDSTGKTCYPMMRVTIHVCRGSLGPGVRSEPNLPVGLMCALRPELNSADSSEPS